MNKNWIRKHKDSSSKESKKRRPNWNSWEKCQKVFKLKPVSTRRRALSTTILHNTRQSHHRIGKANEGKGGLKTLEGRKEIRSYILGLCGWLGITDRFETKIRTTIRTLRWLFRKVRLQISFEKTEFLCKKFDIQTIYTLQGQIKIKYILST